MRVLGVETSTLAGGVALVDGERLIGIMMHTVALSHSERLMASADDLLTRCGVGLGDLDGFAVSVGPGSFTGLRVGIAAVKGLAFATGLPVAAVPTLDAMAAALPFAMAPVCPVLDARKGEVYLARYRWTGREMTRESDYLALPPRAAAARLNPPVIVLGDGLEACRPYFPPDATVWEAPPAQRLPSAALVAQLGHARLETGAAVSADALVPIYLRPSEAELSARRA
jgi:tRNA threonylcarbamoyladenosine biosynthesis protein TsaB